MSDQSDLLTSLGSLNGEVTGAASVVLGSVSSMYGAVGSVVSLVSGIFQLIDQFVNSNQEILDKLNQLETTLQNDFKHLGEELRVTNLLNRLNSLDPASAQAQTVVDQLKDDLSQKPPVDEEYKLSQIGLCLDAVNQLDADDKWLTNFDDEIYYGSNGTDLWTGTLAPKPNPDGTVFSDRYILPDFLRVLYEFVLTAAAFENKFPVEYQVPLQRFAARLKWAHDTSKQGLVIMRQPTASEVGIIGAQYNSIFWWGNGGGPVGGSGPLGGSLLSGWISAGATFPYITGSQPDARWCSPFMVGPAMVFNNGPGGAPVPAPCVDIATGILDPGAYYFQDYGVVHLYSGYSKVSHYPPIPLPCWPTDAFWPQFSASLNLAIRRNYKQAYSAIGLAAAWNTINSLNHLTGDSPLGSYNPDVVWTLREIGQIFGSTFLGLYGTPSSGISLSGVIAGLSTISQNMSQTSTGAIPLLGLTRPLSLRTALKGALDAVTFKCAPGGTPPAPINLY